MSNLLPLLLAMRGRYNFCNMARWGHYGESTFRENFSRSFDWLEFNTLLAEQFLSDDLAIAFDLSYLPKSGKHTPGIGYFYSGLAGRERVTPNLWRSAIRDKRPQRLSFVARRDEFNALIDTPEEYKRLSMVCK